MRDTKAVPGINPKFLEGVLQEHMAEMRKIRETLDSIERMLKTLSQRSEDERRGVQ